MVAMAMFTLFTGVLAYGIYLLIRKFFRAVARFNTKVKNLANAAEVAVDVLKHAVPDDGSIKSS